MLKRICKITFISHGATIYSKAGIINDNLKHSKLSDLGEEEIKHVCQYLKNRGVSYDKIYSSPNACCVQTSDIVAKLFKQKNITIDLPSRNHGVWQGAAYADLISEFGIKIFAENPEGGESLKDFNKRVSGVIKKLVKENKGNRIIVVTTPEIIQSALAKTLNLTPQNQYKMLIKTGTLTQISYFDKWSSVIYSDYLPL